MRRRNTSISLGNLLGKLLLIMINEVDNLGNSKCKTVKNFFDIHT